MCFLFIFAVLPFLGDLQRLLVRGQGLRPRAVDAGGHLGLDVHNGRAHLADDQEVAVLRDLIYRRGFSSIRLMSLDFPHICQHVLRLPCTCPMLSNI